MGLAEFLLARIAEDEAVAREADRVYVHPGAHDPNFGARPDDQIASRYWDRIADPARVLAECEAKRRIVELVEGPLTELAWTASGCSETTDPGDTEVGGKILRNLAQPYASHPDYRSEWAP